MATVKPPMLGIQTPKPEPSPSPGPSPSPNQVDANADNITIPNNTSGVDTTTLDGIYDASYGSSSGGDYSTGMKWVAVTPEMAQRSGKFNPPPHPVSRSFPPIAFPTGSGKNTQSLKELVSGTRFKKGYMYQDADSKMGTAWAKDLWGFNFMYNPTSISYTNSQIDDIDWTNPANSQANLLVGNMSVNVSLYLNRIFDMAAIRENPAGKYGYPRPVSSSDIKGIETRGTEWDLEYLYRVLNGDPVKNPTMANGLPTADWGFIAGVPVWIRFHANMRYKVSVQTVSVNHVMFTRDMVPILTEVQLGLTRLPVIGYNEQTDLDVLNSFEGRTTQSPASDSADTSSASDG